MQQAINYAKALYELIPDKDAVDAVKEMFTGTPLLARVLEDPMVSLKKKHQAAEAVGKINRYYKGAGKNLLPWNSSTR